jgi:hypothetical protein
MMSVSVHSFFTPIEFALEIEYLKVRDLLLGQNYVFQDVKRAIELTAASQHPQCQWLTSLFAGKTVSTNQEARDVFLAEEKKSPASLCFAAVLYPGDEALLRQSADLGYPLAQAKMAEETSGEEQFRCAKFAASQRDRVGFFWLGICCEHNMGCEKDLDKARECYLVAAQLGLVESMSAFGRLVDESDPLRWLWSGRAAELGQPGLFLGKFSELIEKFNSGSGNCAVMFQIGKALSGHASAEKGTIFGKSKKFDKLIGPANSAISFYKSQLYACRRAVDVWSVCAARIGVVKDIRVLIGKLVWETRDLALYKV